MTLRHLCIATAFLAFTGACSPQVRKAEPQSVSATSLTEDELGELGSEIFLMCSHPDLSFLPEFNIDTRPLPDEASALKFGTESFDKVYGREIMQRQQPLRIVRLDYPYADPSGVSQYNGNWVIRGSWNEPPGSKGGTAIMIASQSGEVLCLTHGK